MNCKETALSLLDAGLHPVIVPPGEKGPRTKGWTKVGSPEWLDELFPAWNEQPSEAAS